MNREELGAICRSLEENEDILKEISGQVCSAITGDYAPSFNALKRLMERNEINLRLAMLSWMRLVNCFNAVLRPLFEAENTIRSSVENERSQELIRSARALRIWFQENSEFFLRQATTMRRWLDVLREEHRYEEQKELLNRSNQFDISIESVMTVTQKLGELRIIREQRQHSFHRVPRQSSPMQPPSAEEIRRSQREASENEDVHKCPLCCCCTVL